MSKEVSLEELLKSLEEAEEASKTPEKKIFHRDVAHMDKFIEEVGLKTAPDRIPNYIVFYTYRILWEGVAHNKKVNKIKFFRALNKRFKSARDGRMRYYMLDATAFDMTREGKLKAKHYDEKYQKRIKEKSSKKPKSKKEVQPKG